jgi:glyoxylase-like metal-dependent hydrolase (beta-lactamase superfamily II)
MIKKIKENIWQIDFEPFSSTIYFLKINNKNILIDTGSKEAQQELENSLKELKIKPEQIDIIFLTHAHFDHVGNIELFEKAEIYGSKEDFDCERVIDLSKQPIKEIKIIQTPGHTKGSVCLLYKDILFSGDTLFHNGIGRTDFPNSSPKDMEKSLKKLETIDYKILCPGHDN